MNEYIKRVIENLRKKYKTKCPYELANYLGIILIIQPLGAPLGMYKYINRNKVIFLNADLNEYERRYVLTHEIGHAILHPKSSCFFTNTKNINKFKKEYEANLFASEFLIDFTSTECFYIKNYSIDQIAAYYKVPVELVEFKIKVRKILPIDIFF